MADNTELDVGSGGNKLADAQLTWSGDTAQVQVIANGVLSGSEGSWTYTLFTGGAGAVTAGTPRVTLASNDPAVTLLTTMDADTSAIKTAVELLDNAVDGNYLNVNANIAGTDIVGGAGTVAAGVQRVTLASDDPAVVDLAAMEALLITIDADTGAIKTAVEILDNAISGTEMQVDVVTLPSDTFVAEGGALGLGVLLQGDDGTDRKNVAVDATTGYLQTNVYLEADTFVAEAGALGKGVLLQGDDGSDRHNVAVDADGRILVEVANTTAFAAEGAAVGVGVLLQGDDGADRHNVAVDGTSGHILVDVEGGTAFVAEGGALGLGVLLQGDDGTDRHNVAVDASGFVQVDIAEQSDGTALSVSEANSGDILTAVQFLDNAISGTEMQVDVVAPLPAGTNVIGQIIAALQSNALYDGTTSRTIGHFNVVTSTDGAEIVAAQGASTYIRVLSMAIIGLSATEAEVYFETGTSGTDCFGTASGGFKIAIDADGDNFPGVIFPFNPGGWFETADANEALDIRLSTANTVIVVGNYIPVA